VSAPELPDRAHLPTERALAASAELDRLSVAEALDVFDAEDAGLAGAVARAKPEIVRAIELVVEHLRHGGRLVYVGAGTSGRLGVLDAVECPPTFHSDPEQVQGRIAGGRAAMFSSIEGAEDSFAAGEAAVDDVGERDVVFAIAAGGTTPFAHGALARARARGAATVFLACVPRSAVPDEADVSIRLETGPEVLAGSTRLKAGTATKMVLNRVTTLAFARLGKVHGNRMVDLDTGANRKLTARGAEMLAELTGLDRASALALLERAGGRVKVAVVMQRLGVDASAARARLERAGGFLRRALEG
jgi:N-acetylmuramic acid 6-phosphate etherase